MERNCGTGSFVDFQLVVSIETQGKVSILNVDFQGKHVLPAFKKLGTTPYSHNCFLSAIVTD